ncbi:hypothetical protein ACFS5M_06120 [Lacinutrix iliipiscaria]|uniref:Uncharacterized protein n=1 Tax=Lacinutrix iliipiscaria TaxID=1230532 RepID=A0ABW5WMY3_9FLAO
MEAFLTFLESVNDFFIYNMIGRIILTIFSSFLFILLLLRFLRPNLKISKHICYTDIEGKMYYVFKVVNMSKNDLYDIQFNLVKKIPYMVNKGKKINNRIIPISLSTNHKDHFAKYKKEKDYGDHAMLLRTEHDLSGDIKNKKVQVKLTVTGRHGFSNLTRIVSMEFLDSDAIKENKEFKFGKSLDVM